MASKSHIQASLEFTRLCVHRWKCELSSTCTCSGIRIHWIEAQYWRMRKSSRWNLLCSSEESQDSSKSDVS